MWKDEELISLFLKETPLIDVRSPSEFRDGSIPYSINLPILDDAERVAVGTCYKQRGEEEAIKLGHQLVAGDVKKRKIDQWIEYLKKYPEAEIFCFRGGLRSQISCQWIRERGVTKRPIRGGYKRLRNFFLSWLTDAPIPEMIRIGGLTGTGKTNILQKLPNHIDLELLANHRGSAFGPRGIQPSQITFENHIALELMKLRQQSIIVEDESATIGKAIIPKRFFSTMRSSGLIILEVTNEERLENIFNDYVKHQNADFFVTNLNKIQKKMGNTKINLLSEEIKKAFSNPMKKENHETWIMTLLKEYYDPLYEKDLRLNKEKIIFRGNQKEIIDFIQNKNKKINDLISD